MSTLKQRPFSGSEAGTGHCSVQRAACVCLCSGVCLAWRQARLGVDIESQKGAGDQHPHVTGVAADALAHGKLEVGDIILAVTAATKQEEVTEAATKA